MDYSSVEEVEEVIVERVSQVAEDDGYYRDCCCCDEGCQYLADVFCVSLGMSSADIEDSLTPGPTTSGSTVNVGEEQSSASPFAMAAT